MCIAAAYSLTVNQGHCQSPAVARVEKTQFAGWVAHLLPHLPNNCGSMANMLRHAPHAYPAAHPSSLVCTVKLTTGAIQAMAVWPGHRSAYTWRLAEHRPIHVECFCRTAVLGAFVAGSVHEAEAVRSSDLGQRSLPGERSDTDNCCSSFSLPSRQLLRTVTVAGCSRRARG